MTRRSTQRARGLLGAALLVAACAGCVHVAGTVPAGAPAVAAGRFRAGVARVDITPIPGITMAGHSIVGQIARGYWTRLQARAIYLEDAQGSGLALVQCDLWAISAGLSDRVAEILASDPELLGRLGGRRLGRERIVLAATHTHHSPGLFSTDLFFAGLSGSERGFDPALFEFLARRIAWAIAEAVEGALPAQLHARRVVVSQAFRNRSMEPFRANPEAADEILASHHVTLEQFEEMMYDISADPELTKAYETALTD